MRRTLKLVAILFVIAMVLVLAPNNVFAAEPIILNEENPVLDLTGKTIEGPIIVESGNVIIKGDGTVTSPVYPADYTGTDVLSDYCTIFVTGGNLEINGGTFISNTGWNKAIHAALYVRGNSNVVVNDGTFTGKGKDFALRVCGEAGESTVTINGGNFDSQRVTACADCGGTININGGTWSSDSWYNGKRDILNIYTMASNKQGNIIVKGGTFTDYDPTQIYTEGPYPAKEELEPTNAVPEGYEYDQTTGTVACAHENLEEHKEVPATYEATGTKAHYSCPTCTKLFEDEEATKEITDEETLVIPMLEKDDEPTDEPTDEPIDEPTDEPTSEGAIGESTTTEDEKKEEAKDETPKTGAISFVAILAVIALAGLVFVKRK